MDLIPIIFTQPYFHCTVKTVMLSGENKGKKSHLSYATVLEKPSSHTMLLCSGNLFSWQNKWHSDFYQLHTAPSWRFTLHWNGGGSTELCTSWYQIYSCCTGMVRWEYYSLIDSEWDICQKKKKKKKHNGNSKRGAPQEALESKIEKAKHQKTPQSWLLGSIAV